MDLHKNLLIYAYELHVCNVIINDITDLIMIKGSPLASALFVVFYIMEVTEWPVLDCFCWWLCARWVLKKHLLEDGTKHCEFLVNNLVAKTLIRDGLMTLQVACEMGWSFSNVCIDA